MLLKVSYIIIISLIAPSGYLDEQVRTDEVIDLENLGFVIRAMTSFTSYDAENIYNNSSDPKIPREFIIKPVDERVDIYQAYTDDLYDKFILKAKEIFTKY